MVLTAEAQAGHASSLDSLADAIDLKDFGVQDDGCLQIDEGCCPPKMAWRPDGHIGVTFLNQENDNVEETRRAMVAFHAGALALGEAREPPLDTTNLVGIRDELNVDSSEEAQLPGATYVAYMRRLVYLRDEAIKDGYLLNLASEVDFRQFVGSAPNMQKANLVLMDNGNLRAIWKDVQGTRIGLQFLGGRMAQYVIFKRRSQGLPISRVVGRDSLEGLERQFDAFDLHSLLYE